MKGVTLQKDCLKENNIMTRPFEHTKVSTYLFKHLPDPAAVQTEGSRGFNEDQVMPHFMPRAKEASMQLGLWRLVSFCGKQKRNRCHTAVSH